MFCMFVKSPDLLCRLTYVEKRLASVWICDKVHWDSMQAPSFVYVCLDQLEEATVTYC